MKAARPDSGETAWCDDYQKEFDADEGKPGPDGRVRLHTLAARLDCTTEELEVHGHRIAAHLVRRSTARVRRMGILTDDEFWKRIRVRPGR